MKILVIEDEILIQQSLKKLLEKFGAEVETSSTGVQAIDQIHNTDFDRIVCDLMLKDITGFDIIEDSKKKYSLEEISEKFIIMTAYSSPQVLKKANTYNCILLNKPFENIKDAILTILRGKNDKNS